jgi:OOP family OmpA-OmpF porin
MSRKQPWIVVAGLIATTALPFSAKANDGLYLGIGGAANFMSPEDVSDAGTVIINNQFHNGYGMGLNFGYATAFGLRPELEAGYRYNKFKNAESTFLGNQALGGHYQAYTQMLNLWYDFKSKDKSSALSFVHPYLGGGVGMAEVGIREDVTGFSDAVDDKKLLFAYQAGAGLAFDLTSHMTFSLDGRWLRTHAGNFAVSNDVIDTLGGPSALQTRYDAKSVGMSLRYTFGGSPAPSAQTQHEDNAITPVPVAEATPVATTVQDSDGDGVPDDLDKCPNTPKGFKVDATGCIIQQTVVLQAVNFQFNSDQLTDAAKQTLDSVAAGLAGQPSLQVEIDGHTDSKGTAAYNQKLSARRAESVRHYLISKGASSQMLTAHGFGSSKPVASNDTDDGRAQNRRVEFVVLGGVGANTKVTTSESTAASKAAAAKH